MSPVETLTFPADVKWLHVYCPTCKHGTLIEFTRTDNQITGVRIYDPKPEALPPGVDSLMTVQRACQSVRFLTNWDHAEPV
jgi:hypothetical protein